MEGADAMASNNYHEQNSDVTNKPINQHYYESLKVCLNKQSAIFDAADSFGDNHEDAKSTLMMLISVADDYRVDMDRLLEQWFDDSRR
jgi:hypothetical protein